MKGDFDTWISKKLTAVNPEVDLEVFSSYIKGILEDTDTPQNDKEESLIGILSQIVVSTNASSLTLRS